MLITRVFKITEIAVDDKQTIEGVAHNYSTDYHIVFNHPEKIDGTRYLGTLKTKPAKQVEYLIKEVQTKHKIDDANRTDIALNIERLESLKNPRPIDLKHLQRLKSSINRPLFFGDHAEYVKLQQGKGDITKWQKSRTPPLVFYGESASYGNRFFDLSDIVNGNILFTYTRDCHIPLKFKPDKFPDELIKVQSKCLTKEISVTVKLTGDMLYLTFDTDLISDKYLDIDAYKKTISNIKDRGEKAALVANRIAEHENWLKEGKQDRYIGADLNPDGPGYCVMDGKSNIIDAGFLDISANLKANKRKYESSIVIKTIFELAKHYGCHTIVIEDLKFKQKNFCNKVSNRKIKNLWNIAPMLEWIERRCSEEGLILKRVNPYCSSLIGNIMYQRFDAIAAACEITRRGVEGQKMINGKWDYCPVFDINNVINGLKSLVGFEKMLDSVKSCKTWQDLYNLFATAKWSYRRKDKTFVANLFRKTSNVFLYC